MALDHTWREIFESQLTEETSAVGTYIRESSHGAHILQQPRWARSPIVFAINGHKHDSCSLDRLATLDTTRSIEICRKSVSR